MWKWLLHVGLQLEDGGHVHMTDVGLELEYVYVHMTEAFPPKIVCDHDS